MRLTRPQGIVITVLNIFIVALVAVILFVPGMTLGEGSGQDVPTSVDPDKPAEPLPEHNKLRAPSAGRAENINWETRLMGLGDESVTEVFFSSGNIFVFGNATVKGLDFDSYGGFVCKLAGDGNIKEYAYFDGRLNAVCAYGELFVAAAGDKLYAVDKDCGTRACVERTDGDAVDVLAVDNSRVAVVTQPSSTSLKLTEYAVTSDKWNIGHSTRIDSGYTLKYLDCFDFSTSYVMAVRAHSLPRYDSLVLYSFVAGGDATDNNYGGTGENITRPYGVMPCSDGYIAVTSKNGVATIINIDYLFTVYRSQSLGFTVTDARLLYNNGSYYACFTRTDGAVTYIADSITGREKVSELDGIELRVGEDGFFIGVVGGADGSGEKPLALDIVTDEKDIMPLDVSGGEAYALKRDGDNVTAVVSAVGGDALSAPSGGRDIYILSLKAA